MAETEDMRTLCILGCGNLGTAILRSLLQNSEDKRTSLPFARFIACIQSQTSELRLASQFPQYAEKFLIYRDNNVDAMRDSDVIILALDPSRIEAELTLPGLRDALANKLLISVAAGWTRQKLETTLYGSAITSGNTDGRAWVVRTLPNTAALVSQSLTAIEISEPTVPEASLRVIDLIFGKLGKTVHIPPSLMDATTAVAGSTPAMFAVIVDAMIDAAVAVGMPRDMAHVMIFQAMQGTASLLQSGVHPALLKDQGTSPEGCTIGGLMTMEDAGVRGHVGRALREAVTVARRMDGTSHVNDTK
ncbi:pyrroline-5-carboxylate reductase [Aspergillus udagawae]|uniref:Pyrroline-5-carboxylate reductase n=1 Tax=Aspergillus udagawae TaxID=91492 RepID=A0ABQ1BFK3_9EURO|nr:pyrroline-5-carboxylate reductase [Aspergillus udagawae]